MRLRDFLNFPLSTLVDALKNNSLISGSSTSGTIPSNGTINNLDDVPDSSLRKAMLNSERTKLTGIAPGATINITDASSAVLMDSKDSVILATVQGGVVTAGDNMAKLYSLIQTLNSLVTGQTPDGDNVTNTIQEVLSIFSTYPEGVDIATTLAGKINTTAIVNTLTEVTTGKVLDATQGKALKLLIDNLTASVHIASTYATYALASAAAIGAQKRDITVTADENNGGATTYWTYEGNPGVLVPKFDKLSSNRFQTVAGEIDIKDESITETQLAPAVIIKLNAVGIGGGASINDTTPSSSSTYSSTKINSQVSNSKVTGISITGTTSKTITLTFGDGSTIQANFTDIASNSLTPLSAPVMSTPTVVSSTALTTTWTNVANETNYQLERSTDNATWSTINSPVADVTSFADTGRTASTLYYYRIKAIGNGTVYSDSPYSNVVSATTSAGTATLTAITSWPTLSFVTQSTNNLSFATTGAGQAVSSKFIPNGGTGEVWVTYDEAGTTGYIGVATGTGATAQSSMTISIWKEGANKFRTRDGGTFTAPVTDNALPVSTNSVGRIRFTGTTIFTEVSVDGGTNWIACRNIPQPASDLYVKAFFDTNPTNIRNIRGLNLS